LGQNKTEALTKNPEAQPLTRWPDVGTAAKSAMSIRFWLGVKGFSLGKGDAASRVGEVMGVVSVCRPLGAISGVCCFLRLQRCNLCKLLSICLVHCFVRQISADSCRLPAKNAAISMAEGESYVRLYLPHFVIAFGGVKLGVPIHIPAYHIPIAV